MTRESHSPDGQPHQNGPLTEQSTPGRYLIVTQSGTIYCIELVDHDSVPAVTRYPKDAALNKDGTPLPGVEAFSFDTRTGHGEIRWWKDNPADYDRPDLPYIGTIRTTSHVLVILRVDDIDDTDPTPDMLAESLRTALALGETSAFPRFIDALLTADSLPPERE